jgi:hypothetical protein
MMPRLVQYSIAVPDERAQYRATLCLLINPIYFGYFGYFGRKVARRFREASASEPRS